jgi:hypothetical protein
MILASAAESALNERKVEAKAAAEPVGKNEEQLRIAGAALTRAIEKKSWDEAAAKLSEVEKLMPGDKKERLELTRFMILMGKKQYSAAYKLAAQVSDADKENIVLQNQLAWIIVADKDVAERDLVLAETMAERANAAAAKGKDDYAHAGTLDTLARVRFMRGKKDEAIALQEEAVQLATGDIKTGLQRVLDSYKKGELPK